MLDMEANDGSIHAHIITAHILRVFEFRKFDSLSLGSRNTAAQKDVFCVCAHARCGISVSILMCVHIDVCASPPLSSPVCQSECRCAAGPG